MLRVGIFIDIVFLVIVNVSTNITVHYLTVIHIWDLIETNVIREVEKSILSFQRLR